MTDKKRIKILEKVKERIENGQEFLICNGINTLTKCWTYSNAFKIFPELKKYKPRGAYSLWFSINLKKPRIKILNSMITEIKSKSND